MTLLRLSILGAMIVLFLIGCLSGNELFIIFEYLLWPMWVVLFVISWNCKTRF